MQQNVMINIAERGTKYWFPIHRDCPEGLEVGYRVTTYFINKEPEIKEVWNVKIMR